MFEGFKESSKQVDKIFKDFLSSKITIQLSGPEELVKYQTALKQFDSLQKNSDEKLSIKLNFDVTTNQLEIVGNSDSIFQYGFQLGKTAN